MTESEIRKLFEDAEFIYHSDDDENIIWFSQGVNNVHVFRYQPNNVHLHINSSDFSFYKHCELGSFPDKSVDAIDFIDKIKILIKIYGK